MESFNRKEIDFEAARNSVDSVSIAQGYTHLKGKGRDISGPCRFCGGVDRFYLHRDGQHFGCRKCGFWGDVIDLVSKADGISKADAARKLSGGDLPSPTPRARAIARPLGIKAPLNRPQITAVITADTKAKTPTITPVDPAQQSRWIKIIDQAEKSLEGSAAHRYLEDIRGLDMSTARRFRLGSGSFNGRPVLVIPVIGEGGVIEAVKYRFVDQLAQDEKSKRFAQEPGSGPGLFGGHFLSGSRFLVIVEGELNAVSISQAIEDIGDVLSIGSQSGNILQAVEIAKRYSKFVVWFDEGEKAAETVKHIRNAIPLQSPDMGSGPLDANDILKTHGVEFLRAMMRDILGLIKSEHECESATPVSTGNVEETSRGGIKIREGAPPIPAHIQPHVKNWTKEIAENWAWADWLRIGSDDRPGLPAPTTSDAIAYVLEKWSQDSLLTR
ncbi:MAG: hypothetical protein K8R88_00915 [Armatimonadetes bacterium]|nr:hypothetical protein [Armatimonadota bacterium]